MTDTASNATTGLVQRFFGRLGKHELGILLGLVAVTAGIWLFVWLANMVSAGESRAFDRKVLLLMRDPANQAEPWGPHWVEEMGRDLTALGGVTVLTLITGSVSGFLFLQRKKRAAVLVLAAVASGLILSTLLKQAFDRSRPDLVPHGSFVYTSSFPSGHSMLSAVTYLSLASLLSRVQPKRRMRAYVFLIAILLTVTVGLSRVYLGVHWPTDVLSGWTAGVLWALICWLGARWLQRKGHVEDENQRDPPVSV